VKVRSGEHCNPTTWSGHSHNALGYWRTYALDSGTSPKLGKKIGFPTKAGRNDVIIYIHMYLLDRLRLPITSTNDDKTLDVDVDAMSTTGAGLITKQYIRIEVAAMA